MKASAKLEYQLDQLSRERFSLVSGQGTQRALGIVALVPHVSGRPPYPLRKYLEKYKQRGFGFVKYLDLHPLEFRERTPSLKPKP